MSQNSQDLTQNVVPSLNLESQMQAYQQEQLNITTEYVAPRSQLRKMENTSIQQTPKQKNVQLSSSDLNNKKTPKYQNFNKVKEVQAQANITKNNFTDDKIQKPIKKVNLKIQAQQYGTDQLGYSNKHLNSNYFEKQHQRKVPSQSYMSDFDPNSQSNTEIYDQIQEENQIRKINNVIANHLENSRQSQSNSFTSMRSAVSSQFNTKASIASLAYILKEIQDPTVLYSLSNTLSPKLKKEISNISGIQDYLEFVNFKKSKRRSPSSDPDSIHRKGEYNASDIYDILETLQDLQSPQQKDKKIQFQQSSQHKGDKIYVGDFCFDEEQQDQFQKQKVEKNEKSKQKISNEIEILKEGIILAAEKILQLKQQNNEANNQIQFQSKKIQDLENNFKTIQEKQNQDIDLLKNQIQSIQTQPITQKQSQIVPISLPEVETTPSAQVTQNANAEIQCKIEIINEQDVEKNPANNNLIKQKQSKCGNVCKCAIF